MVRQRWSLKIGWMAEVRFLLVFEQQQTWFQLAIQSLAKPASLQMLVLTNLTLLANRYPGTSSKLTASGHHFMP
jgi:hypothetical protein